MLVLLIIFMVTAPLLTAGVPLNYRKAQRRPKPRRRSRSLSVSLSKGVPSSATSLLPAMRCGYNLRRSPPKTPTVSSMCSVTVPLPMRSSWMSLAL